VLKGDRNNLKDLREDISDTLKLRPTKIKSKIISSSPLPSQSPSHFDSRNNKNSLSLGIILSSQKI
jgi:hypothetical protein